MSHLQERYSQNNQVDYFSQSIGKLYKSNDSNSRQTNDRTSFGRPPIGSIRNIFAKAMASANYFQALSKCLLWIYTPLFKKQNAEKQCASSKLSSNKKLVASISEFVENNGSFLKGLEMLSVESFPSVQKYLTSATSFQEQYMKQLPSRTFSFAIRQLKKKFQCSKTKIREVDLKCLYLGSILLVGNTKIDLNIKQNESLQQRFNRIVLKLLGKSKLLNKETFDYILKYWPSIMELVANQIIQVDSSKINQSEMDVQCCNSPEEVRKSLQKRNQLTSNLSKSQKSQKSTFFHEQISFEFDNESFIFESYPNGIQGQKSIASYSNVYYEEDDLFYQILSSSPSPSLIQNQMPLPSLQKVEEMISSTKLQKKNVSKREDNILKKRAIQYFNYKKLKSRKRSANEILKQKVKQSESRIKKRLPHPTHSIRQIDVLIDLFIGQDADQFVLAHAIANHIFHGLEVQKIEIIRQQ